MSHAEIVSKIPFTVSTKSFNKQLISQIILITIGKASLKLDEI